MSTFGIFAIIILPILGGLIAWAGDVIGYRLGKSRRSLLGLRPRTTARLVGVTVGVLLPLVGLGTALLGSNDARDAILHIDQLRKEQARLTSQNSQLSEQISRARLQADTSKREALELHKNWVVASMGLDKAQNSLQNAEQRLKVERKNVHNLRTQGVRLEADKAALDQIRKQLSKQIDEQKTLLAETGHQLDEKNAELTRKAAELTSKQAALDHLTAAYVDQLRAVASPVVLEPGHILLRAVINPARNQQEMENSLRQLLVTASDAAHAQGADTSGPGGLAVVLVRPIPSNLKTDGTFSQQDIIAWLAAELLKGNKQFVVDVRVWKRMYQNEKAPVLVEMYPLPYVRVFVKDEVIYSTTLNGADSRTEIFSQLWNLVTKLIRREAQEKGLLTRPNTTEYGTLPASQLLEALDEVAAAKRPVTVQVVAVNDTYIIDPLVIRIEVKSGESPPGRASGGSGT